MKAFIQSTGYYVPDYIRTNEELSSMVDTNDEWIYSHTGIRERRIAGPDQAASDLAVEASLKAIEKAAISADDIDIIILATSTPDHNSFPSTASLVQDKLGARNAAAMDISAACSGFAYALETGKNFIASGSYKHVLVIGTEVFSRIIDWTDRDTCVLFGDGAGAVVLSQQEKEESYILDSILGSDGSGAPYLIREAGGSRYPKNETDKSPFVTMNGRRVYNFAVKVIGKTILDLLDRNNYTIDDIDYIVPHQANIRIIEACAKRTGIPLEKFFTDMEFYANTSAASIPIALGEMEEKGLLHRGNLIITVGFGAGLTYAGNLLRW
ncbi:beta-ketoacyl-ACP synthase III [Spirochaeta cellobiosiphila]|uniref:beta-ketoacyl-ACP synthase III n=1 Tax=Spirochaeta cellobiosiphila TaxID=504483 RepID=UPI0004251E24|nr:beta-ketoacyl-ACP synthase III [Spirochaeta cellobiosiphila]